MATVAIAGAGAIARAYAALLAREGHAAALWSPSGAGVADLPPADAPAAEWPGARAAVLAYAGAAEGRATVAVLHDPAAIGRADVVIVAVPAPAYAVVLPQVAAHVTSRQCVFVSAALSLAPLWLAELAASRGAQPLIAAAGTTVATARGTGGGVAIMTIRGRLSVAPLPAAEGPRARAALAALFGDRFDGAANVLAATLTNISPVAHAAMALANVTRIERGEAWPQYHYLTPAVARLAGAMDRERRAIAAAFGLDVTTIEQHFQRSFGVAATGLADIAAELHAKRGGPPGPTTLDTRFVLEDVPYGLVCNAALARVVNVAVPVTDATITLVSTLYGMDFAQANPLLDALGLAVTSRDALLARCAGAAR
ncbi:MAG: NAD/NADP octopine/nopaline dehydrogenase family protein [Burkholderiales bacterium]